MHAFTLCRYNRLRECKYTHEIHNLRPTREGDALKYSQHCQTEVVKVGNAIVGTFPASNARNIIIESERFVVLNIFFATDSFGTAWMDWLRPFS